MANRMLKPLLLAAGALAVVASPAHAVLQIAAHVDGFPTITCVDQTACDLDPTVGILELAPQAGGGVTFFGSTQIQQIATATGTFNVLNSSGQQIINNTGLPLAITIAIGGTDFEGPVTSYSASGSGTVETGIGSTATFEYYGDSTNQQGAGNPNDKPGTLLASATFTANQMTYAFSQNDSGAFVASGPFSFTLWASGVLAPGGSLVNRGQTIVAQQVQVPEPGSLLLLTGALLGFGRFARKRWTRTTTAATA
jgi:hypothetical protein